MAKNSKSSMDRWVSERLATLTPSDEWQPNINKGLAGLRQREAKAGTKQNWALAAAATIATCLYIVAFPTPRTAVQHLWKDVFFTETSVVRTAGSQETQSDLPSSAPTSDGSAHKITVQRSYNNSSGADVLRRRVGSIRAVAINTPDYSLPPHLEPSTKRSAQSEPLPLAPEISSAPGSTLEVVTTYMTFFAQNNFPKTIESADQLLMALGDKADAGTRLLAVSARVQAFSELPAYPPPDTDQLKKERDAALLGVKLLEAFPKANQAMSDEDFEKQKRAAIKFFYSAAAVASMKLDKNVGSSRLPSPEIRQ